jgi:hypothetical protein
MKTLEVHKENNEMLLERIKEVTCNTLKLQNACDASGWETSLTRALVASTVEHINFLRAVQGQRILFMPHSPGIYIALVLNKVSEIDADNLEHQMKTSPFKIKDMNSGPGSISSSESSSSKSDNAASVRRLTIKNNLFLDINSLSKNLQTILK